MQLGYRPKGNRKTEKEKSMTTKKTSVLCQNQFTALKEHGKKII